MKPTHILGLGFLVGMAALGAMVAAVTFRWAETAYSAAAGVPGAERPVRGGAAPASQEVAQGETIFKQRCSSCHTIGGGRLAGPDLRGVTAQRPRDWLIAFIVEPDKVIASGDPVAAQLVKEYGVPMPNVGVARPQAEQVLAYIDFQSGGAAPGAARAAQPTVEPPAPTGPTAVAPTSAPAAAPVAPASPTAAAAAAPAGAPSTQGKPLFDQKCAGCHTIGGGRTVGPDLKGITAQRPRDWLIRFTVEPDKVIASGDPVAAQLVKEYGMPMPNVGVTNAQAEEILAYIDAQSGAAAAPAPAPVQPGDPAVGRALFVGQKPMASGGPACAACHNVAGAQVLGGGTWGLDLTHSQSKTGTAGLVSIMKNPPFPGMKEAYQNHPVTDAEAADLAAFFIEVDRIQGAESFGLFFVPVGMMLFVLLALLARWAWRNRTPSVWRQLIGQGNREWRTGNGE